MRRSQSQACRLSPSARLPPSFRPGRWRRLWLFAMRSHESLRGLSAVSARERLLACSRAPHRAGPGAFGDLLGAAALADPPPGAGAPRRASASPPRLGSSWPRLVCSHPSAALSAPPCRLSRLGDLPSSASSAESTFSWRRSKPWPAAPCCEPSWRPSRQTGRGPARARQTGRKAPEAPLLGDPPKDSVPVPTWPTSQKQVRLARAERMGACTATSELQQDTLPPLPRELHWHGCRNP
mmetsp:Transcript_96376/g.229512  ORF Transcript_96376/g.229512 Transcript_96376/m.229512 type:complete len:238 (+) Transcript_96376:421-1134(+)